ncbi:hypothetical protein CPC08DRAFT_705585 [Agrocybe pediades]|nr:hypothetical protein CPC08DRAFT_705585 [Agrocybe pediades]
MSHYSRTSSHSNRKPVVYRRHPKKLRELDIENKDYQQVSFSHGFEERMPRGTSAGKPSLAVWDSLQNPAGSKSTGILLDDDNYLKSVTQIDKEVESRIRPSRDTPPVHSVSTQWSTGNASNAPHPESALMQQPAGLYPSVPPYPLLFPAAAPYVGHEDGGNKARTMLPDSLIENVGQQKVLRVPNALKPRLQQDYEGCEEETLMRNSYTASNSSHAPFFPYAVHPNLQSGMHFPGGDDAQLYDPVAYNNHILHYANSVQVARVHEANACDLEQFPSTWNPTPSPLQVIRPPGQHLYPYFPSSSSQSLDWNDSQMPSPSNSLNLQYDHNYRVNNDYNH